MEIGVKDKIFLRLAMTSLGANQEVTLESNDRAFL
jgi:hypothetical protein